MKEILFICLILYLPKYSVANLPEWDLAHSSISLLQGDENSYEYQVIAKNENYMDAKLFKYIRINGAETTNNNWVEVTNKENVGVYFENIESVHNLYDKYIICPRGKFHPMYYASNNNIAEWKPTNFNENWDLKCYQHNSGNLFIVAYRMKSDKYIYTCKFSEINGGLYDKGFIGEKLYDFRVSEEACESNTYKMASIILKNGNLVLSGAKVDINKDSGSFANKGNEKSNVIVQAGKYSQAYFVDNTNKFYFLTYNNVSDFSCGYSISDISDFYEVEDYSFEIFSDSPLAFTDDVEIQEMNIMLNGKYAYYKIYNKDNQQTYHGIIDLHNNLVVFNTAETINSFVPISQTEILAITPTQAYKVCIIKNDNGDGCLDSCSTGTLILDVEGNKCATECESGKLIKLPGNICIPSESCDTNIYQKDETYCRLCKYIDPTTSKYRLVNDDSKTCRSQIPDGAEEYNTKLNLLRCKSGYRLEGDNCVTYCYSLCNTCSDYSTDEENQKCYSCIDGYFLEEGTNNCKKIISTTIAKEPTTFIDIIPTTITKIPTTMTPTPSTITKIPTTSILQTPSTITKIPTTSMTLTPSTITKIPTTSMTLTPSTITKLPTTSMIAENTTMSTSFPTSVITTMAINSPTTVITTTDIIETIPNLKCKDEKCLTCNEESNSKNLCLSCNERAGYKKVNYTIVLTKFVDCLKQNNPILKHFYFNETTQEYRPCYKTCKSCLIGGDAESQNCLECNSNYMFRPGDNPHNNCVAYSEYYYINDYNQFKSLEVLNCPEEAKYVVKEKNYCINDCKKDKEYKYLYNARCVANCPSGTINNSFICTESKSKSYLGINDIFLEENDNLTIIETLILTYLSEFSYTNNHASLYNSDYYNILLYKNPNILNDFSLKMSKVDFKDCYDKVKDQYGIEEDLLMTVVEKKKTNNPTSYYSFYNPKTGEKLDAETICKDETIVVKENLTSVLNENDSNYNLQTSLTSQGINIFDINDPFYTDLCFDFDNPTNKDIPLSDRIKSAFPNITLCSDGCQNDGINLEDMTATCNCKFNDITNNAVVKENTVLNSMVGEIFDLVNSSNILVVKCGKHIFKYFKRSIGGIITVSIIFLNMILTYTFFLKQLPKITSYVTTITSRFIEFFSKSTNYIIAVPPKKVIKYEEKNIRRNSKGQRKLSRRKSQKRSSQNNNYVYNNYLTSQKDINEPSFDNSYQDRVIQKFVEDYLEPSPDEMEYDDAIKKDTRTFCQYFKDNLKEKQIIANTFIAVDPIKSRAIKIILFNLNIVLYFVINGLFISESYISELYNLDETKETFFSFLPRSLERLIYATLVSLIIGYITGFFFLEEKKLQGIFRRDMEDKLALKQDIINLVKTLKKRYISFIIFVFVILLLSLYYLLCFNYVYPKTQIEWIKSSIAIIIIIQILSLLVILLEAIIRFLSFKCESEKLFKLGRLLS